MTYTTEIMIRGYHVDAYGHVNNARWVELLEEARWRWLDESLDLSAWDAIGQGIAVVNLEVSYRRPAHMHDRLAFRCWVEKLGGRAAVCRQDACRLSDGMLLLDARVTFVLIDHRSGRVRPLAGEIRAMLERFLAAAGQPGPRQADR